MLLYASIVTLKIKVLCSRTSLPLDTRSSKIYTNSNSHDHFFVLLDINPSYLYDAYGLYANSVTLKLKVRCSITSLPFDMSSSNIYKNSNINDTFFAFVSHKFIGFI